jgi:phage protein D
VLSIVVDSDTGNPDMASIAVTPGTTLPDAGRALSIATVDGEPVFTGEIVDVQAVVDRSGHSVVMIHALNPLHRLTRGKHTRTFDLESDADIARQLAFEAGLQAETPGPEASIQHDRVYQHNQTDLEFLLERAARIGYDVFADETTLYFQRSRDTRPTTIGCLPSGVLLKAFRARLSSTASVTEVTVRGWDPTNQEEIIGRARQGVIGLSPATSRIDPQPSTINLGFVEALSTGAAFARCRGRHTVGDHGAASLR